VEYAFSLELNKLEENKNKNELLLILAARFAEENKLIDNIIDSAYDDHTFKKIQSEYGSWVTQKAFKLNIDNNVKSIICKIWKGDFRALDDPTINDDKYLVSPADGIVLQVIETNGPKELGLENRKFKTQRRDRYRELVNMAPKFTKKIKIFFKTN
jgi:hypothetical protein